MSSLLKPIFYTSLALIAFAGNSVLCRLALNNNNIDAASFTNIRLLSGAITLLVLFFITRRHSSKTHCAVSQTTTPKAPFCLRTTLLSPSLPSKVLPAIYLFIYAIGFSYAYISLATGTGALILFACVQLTLLLSHFLATKRVLPNEVLGLIIAFSGLVILVYPAISTPSFSAFLPMALAGVAWGLYTISGKKSTEPLQTTTLNFLLTIPLIVLTFVFTFNQVTITEKGLLLAIMSGAITSGLGYFLWFIALRYLTGVQAGVLQLLVPIIATIGGVVFANEPLTLSLVIALVLVLGGIFIVLNKK